MIWTPSWPWAPYFEVTVQSHPNYFIEIAIYCTLALIIGIGLRAKFHLGPNALLRAELTSSRPPPSKTPQDLWPHRTSRENDENFLGVSITGMGEDRSDGDGDVSSISAVKSIPQHVVEPPLPEPPEWVTLVNNSDAVYLSCAACRGHSGQGISFIYPPSPKAGGEDRDGDSFLTVDDADDESSSSSESNGDSDSGATEAVRATWDDQQDMVGYVAARYKGFKRAAQEGQLLVVDPTSSTLAENDLVAILSLALTCQGAWLGTANIQRHGDGVKSHQQD